MRAWTCLALLPTLCFAWPLGSRDDGPTRESQEAKARRDYPQETYLVGIGESPTSAEDASLQARAEVSRQVDLSVHSTMESFLEEKSSGGSDDLKRRLTSSSKAESHFDNAQIIACDPPVRSDKSWIVVAHLSRAEGVAALAGQYEDSASRFRRRVEEALLAPDLATFSVSWRDAARLGAWLDMQGVRFVSIKGLALSPLTMGEKNPHAPQYPRDMALLRALDSARSARLARQHLEVRLDSLPGFQATALQAVKDAGLALGNGQWQLCLRWERTESESSIGEIMRCRLVPVLDLRHASGSSLSSPPLQEAAGEGYRVRDRDGACADARDKVDPEPMKSALQALLRQAFPIP